MNKLDKKIALITGGTSGIGEAIAKLFSEEGATVIICGRNEEKGESVLKYISKFNNDSTFIKCDISNPNLINELYNQVVEKYKRLDILVNCAGILVKEQLQDITEESWDNVLNTNLHSIVRTTQKFIDLIVESKGNILNVSSIDGLQSFTRGRANYAYGSSKAALIKFSQLLALNYAENIRVNCLCPGVTDTPIFTNRDFSRFIDGIPMRRIGQPTEIAKAALFLCSDDASFITGAILTCDGGGSLL